MKEETGLENILILASVLRHFSNSSLVLILKYNVILLHVYKLQDVIYFSLHENIFCWQ
jgi:hypothetical protein